MPSEGLGEDFDGRVPLWYIGANKGFICRGNTLDSLLKVALFFEPGERLIHWSAWKVNSTKFALTEF